MLLFALLCAAELIAILSLNRGAFVYTLDDPYLHLALAEGIARGHYGLNLVDASAPSSSFLWPFLLAPFAHFPAGAYVPLALNICASLLSIMLFRRVLGMVLADAPHPTPRGLAWLVATTFMLATNLVGLVFTGMEHSLQVMLSLALAVGLIETVDRGHMPRWLPAVIVLGPFVRYENLALSLPAVMILLWRRRTLVALGCLAALVAGLGGFSVFLHSRGLGWLPLSVVAKSAVVAEGGSLSSVLHSLRMNAKPGLFLGLLFVTLAISALRATKPGDRALALWAAAAIALHFAAGRFGWFARYEIYVWSVALTITMHVTRDRWRPVLARMGPLPAAALFAVFLGLACRSELAAVGLTPLAANNIYEQQYQMRRFAAEFYRAPVGANDLGLVSYRNDHYVLDLEGLSAKETVDARRSFSGSAWMDTLAARHGVRLAMVYAQVFSGMPKGWTSLGKLHLRGRCITPSDSLVEFWAVDRATASVALSRLRDFRTSLPPGVRFEFAAGFSESQ